MYMFCTFSASAKHLMTKLEMNSSIVFGFEIVFIIGLMFRLSLLVLSFVGVIVGYDGVTLFWNCCL